MGLQKRIYTSQCILRSVVLYICLISTYTLCSQNNCLIKTASEPLQTQTTSTQLSTSQQSKSYTISWSTLSNSDTTAHIKLEGLKISNTLQLSNLGLDIPSGAIITGIKLTLTGKSIGSGYVKDNNITLSNGLKISENYAGLGYSAKRVWAKKTYNERWHYGRNDETWGQNWTSKELNSEDFTINIQVRNILNQEVQAILQGATIEVTFTPLPTFCVVSCPVFYVEGFPTADSYKWHIPEGIIYTSKDDESYIVDLHINDAALYGIYNLCVDAYEKNVIIGQCCRDFRYVDCNPGSIGDFVWNDINANGIQDPNEQGVIGISIKLFDKDNQLINITTTNSNGKYSFLNVVKGKYYIKVDIPNKYKFTSSNAGNSTFDSNITGLNGLATSSIIDVDYAENVTDIDVGLIEQTEIKGLAWEDLNGDGARLNNEPKLQGINVHLVNQSGDTILQTITDNNGNYEFKSINVGSYNVRFEFTMTYHPTLKHKTQDDLDSDINPDFSTGYLNAGASGLSNMDAGVYASNFIGDQIWEDLNCNGEFDPTDKSLSNIEVLLINEFGIHIDSTITDSIGNYRFENILPGSYKLKIKDQPIYTATQKNNSILNDINGVLISDPFTILSGGHDKDLDLGLIKLRSNICGTAWFDTNFDGIRQVDEPLIAGLVVNLIDTIDQIIENKTTDIDGNYCFKGYLPALYKIQFVYPDYQIYSPYAQGAPDKDSDVINSLGMTSSLMLVSGKNIDNIDVGLANKAIVGDFVWIDENSNGLQDINENGLPDVKINLLNIQGVVVDSTISDEDGYYLFEFIEPMDYYLSLEFDNKNKAVLDLGGDKALNSDFTNVNGPNTSSTFTLKANEINFDFDFGLENNLGTICGVFWIDENLDGIRSGNESATLDQIMVETFDSAGNLSSVTFTDFEGRYCAIGIPAGDYTLKATLPNNYQLTLSKIGMDTSIDSDFGLNGTTNSITLLPGETLNNYDGGVTLKSNIGDYVWKDTDGNGIQDNNEIGIQDIQVRLMDANDNFVDGTTTNESGFYLFNNVASGNYYCLFTLAEGLVFTKQNISSTLGSDSDVNGYTPVFIVNPFIDNLDIDAGMTEPLGSIQGLAWQDTNSNGQIDANEPFIPNVEVQLLDKNLIVLQYTSTDSEGKYSLFPILKGDYYVVFDQQEATDFTSPHIGSNLTDSDVTSSALKGSTDLIVLDAGETKLNIDAGYILTGGTIKGISWIDLKGDGIYLSEDKVLINNVVNLYDLDTVLIETQNLENDGSYSFTGILPGDYFITFSPSEDCYVPTLINIGNDTLIDSDITSQFYTNSTNLIHIEIGSIVCGINGGFIGYSTISGMAFNDFNENGIRDTNDAGFNDIIVCLKDIMGNSIEFDTTSIINGIDGIYEFNTILPGKYIVKFTRPLFYLPTLKDQGSNDTIDSDVSILSALIAITDTIEITSKSLVENVDLGLIFSQEMQSMVAGEVWRESQVDGIQQITETLEEGIEIKLFAENGTLITSDLTDLSGAYQFPNLAEGFYYLEATLPLTEAATYLQKGNDSTLDNDFTTLNDKIRTPIFYLDIFTDTMHIDLGITDAITIGDYVWNDTNFDGIQQSTEPPYEGAELVLMDDNSNTLMSTISDINGKYSFKRMPIGKYQLKINLPTNEFTTRQNTGPSNTDSDYRANGLTPIYNFNIGGQVDTIDAGVVSSGSIGNMIFIDYNGNGINNSNEPGMSGYQVSLYNDNNELIAVDTTKGDMILGQGGFYTFDNVRPGEYYLVFDIENGYKFTIPNTGAENVDSDVTSIISFGATDIFTLMPNEMNVDLDCGIYLPSTLGDYVWEDINKNGIQEAGENGFANVEVLLLKSNGQIISSTVTDNAGKYLFTGLNQGLYSVKFGKIPDYEITLKDSAPDDMTDSDADPITGVTSLISLAHGATFLGVDCGYFSTTNANDFNPGLPHIGETKILDEPLLFEILHPMPNPAVFETLLRVEEDGIYQLTMMNTNGQIVELKTVTASGGAIKLDISHYRAGKFYFLLSSNTKTYRGSLIRVF